MVSLGFHSKRKLYFQVLLVLFVLSLLGYAFVKVDGFFLQQKITDQSKVVQDQSTIAASYKLLTGYNKLQAVKGLENQQADIPWSDHINKVIQMLEDLKRVQSTTSDTIVLSDFNVSLDKISLKGKVSDLQVLYASQANSPSLLDRFSALDFIKNIQIKTYDQVGDNNYFEFVLEANVVTDGTSK